MNLGCQSSSTQAAEHEITANRPCARERGIIRWPIALALGTLVLLSVSSSPPEPAKQEISSETKSVAESNSAFAFELFSRMKDRREENLIVSPFSVSSALAMAYGGARGNTEKQMAETFHFPTNQAGFHSRMETILTRLTNSAREGALELHVANGLWPQKELQFTADFMALCRQNYHAEARFLDFKTDTELARRQINSWIQLHTKGKINDLFVPGAITTATRLVIANSVYFKGAWASRFDKGRTRSDSFWVSFAKSVQVPTTRQKSTFVILAEGNAQILELPYQGEDISMLVILPKDQDGLAELEKQLTLEQLNHWIEGLHPAIVDVALPRFKANSKFSLRSTLAGMGMPDAFDDNRADFTGMTTFRPFFIGVVEHAAVVEVDEEGTVAAAATGSSFGCAAHPPPTTFYANHPFLFLIRDRRTGTVLFLGRVVDPSASGHDKT